jgi:diacylglycerol O-acyltransferase / wax synthase
MVTAERMSPVDRAWLQMERPTNPMTIVAVIVLGGRLTLNELRRLVAERLLVFNRFRCRPVQEALGARWELAETFDLHDHVMGIALPEAAGQEQLETLTGELASTPLNASRPWWAFHLVENYGAGCAIIARIHHCYADGIALMRVLLRMTDGAAGQTPDPAPAVAAQGMSSNGALSSLYAPIAGLLANTLREGANLLDQGMSYALHPARAADAARDAAGLVGDLARITVLPDDPQTRLKRSLSGTRRVAWAPPLVFDEVRTIGRVLGCTINDVLIATLTGALARYLETEGESLADLTLHAAVPVNMRPEAEVQTTLGNRFGLVFVELPVGIRHPLERLYAVHAAMQTLKGSSQALVTFGLLTAVGSLPAAIEESAIEIFTAKASLVASNVPGPREALCIGGVPIEQMLFWVPQAGSIGTGVSMLTYNGKVQFGVMSDRELVPDPRKLVRLVEGEFERLVLLVLLGGPVLAGS